MTAKYRTKRTTMHTYRLLTLVGCSIALLLSTVFAGPPAATQAAQAGCGPQAHLVPGDPSVPTAYPNYTQLNAVAAAGVGDVWAVGTENGNPLVEHWVGYEWQRVAAPRPNPNQAAELHAIAVIK